MNNKFRLVKENIEMMVTGFLNLYTLNLNDCESEEDYFELMTSVIVFSNLIKSEFLSRDDAGIDVTPELLDELKNLAFSITKSIQSDSEKENIEGVVSFPILTKSTDLN